MSFRDFISNHLFRRTLEANLERYKNIRPPANPSRRYIDKLVHRLLKQKTAWDARKELSMMGAAVVPSLVEAMRDPRFHRAEWEEFSMAPAPLEAVLELLVPHGPQQVLAAALPLVDSPSDEVRKTAALHLASLGRDETVPVLARLLQDTDGYVRAYVQMGVDRALEAGRAGDQFRRQMYELLLAQCDQEWKGTLNDAPEAVIALDPARAAVDFAEGPWLSVDNRNTYCILQACNRARILLPESRIRALLDHSLPLAVGEQCHPHPYVAAEALVALTMRLGEPARPLLQAALDHEQDQIHEAAARGIAMLAGLDDPMGHLFRRVEEAGVEGLTHPQRVVHFAHMFDAEVCNGGIMQFFGNSSGDHAIETLDALRELGHAEAVAALETALKHVGPLAREADRELRLTAFEGRFDELRAVFEPLESAYYRTSGKLRQKMLLYAAQHAEHFRSVI